MQQKTEVDRLAKEINVESPQEISQHLQNLSSFVSPQKAFEKLFNQKNIEIQLNIEEIPKNYTFHYFSILRTIEVLFSKQNLQKYVLSSGHTENDRVICKFKDDLMYKNNPLWASSNKALPIMLYCDEFVCAIPLGNKVKKI